MAFTCPHCNTALPDKNWLSILFELEEDATIKREDSIHSYAEDWDKSNAGDYPIEHIITGQWMRCLECNYVLVRFERTRGRHIKTDHPFRGTEWTKLDAEMWLVIPRRTTRHLDLLVESKDPNFARDYQEAAEVLGNSPRLSALLSRRILADVLAKYATLTDYTLSDRIDKFIADPSHPSALKDVLHALRDMGNWTAHTKVNKNDQAIIIEASPDEAAWALDVLDRLFDYFIVRPEKDAAILKAISAKKASIGPGPAPAPKANKTRTTP